jgi:hypothetical protein
MSGVKHSACLAAGVAGGISVAHSASCGFALGKQQAANAGDIKADVARSLVFMSPTSRACFVLVPDPQLALWATDMPPATPAATAFCLRDQSWRNATIGSTPMARRAGNHAAARAIAGTSSATLRYVRASSNSTP